MRRIEQQTTTTTWRPREARRLPKFRLMLLFETLLVRGGYNSGVALKWPPCSTALKYFQYPAAEWDSSCLFSALAISILFSLSLSLFLYLSLVSFFISLLYLSIRLSTLLPRLLFAVASSQSSFMPPGGEDLITYGEWTSVPFSPYQRFAPLLEILVAWRVLILLPFLFFYFDHLLRFLKILFMRRAWELKDCWWKK